MTVEKENKKIFPPLAAITVSLFLFALLYRRPGALKAAAVLPLVAAFAVIINSARRAESHSALFGFNRFKLNYFFLGVITGVIFAFAFRVSYGLSLLPQTLTVFSLTAALIGISEEIIFRGFIQTKARAGGIWFSILAASSAHTLYKTGIFMGNCPQDVSFIHLVLITFLGGIIFGALREFSKSVYPVLAAHALFDILVYGGAFAPWWVW